MLTLERCRELIPDDQDYTDEEIIAIRDALTGLGRQQIELFRMAKNESNYLHSR